MADIVPDSKPIQGLVSNLGGSLMEWYDWSLYVTLIPYISQVAFPSTKASDQIISGLAVFAVSFIARPIGGITGGYFSDTYERSRALTWTVLAATVGTVIMAALPSWQQIGVASPVILVVARLIQGFAHGAEVPAAQTVIVSDRTHRGLRSSTIFVAATVGSLLALAVCAMLRTYLPSDDMHSWGWRIPFVLSIIGGAYFYLVRRRVVLDTAAGCSTSTDDRSLETHQQIGRMAQLRGNRRAMLLTAGLTSGMTIAYFAWVVSASDLAELSLHLSRADAQSAALLGQVSFLIALPFWGWLSDIVGRRIVLGIACLGVFTMAAPLSLASDGHAALFFILLPIATAFVAAASSIMPAVYADLFPDSIRALGFAIPYSLVVAFLGGTAPLVLAWSYGRSNLLFPAYVMICTLVSAACVARISDTSEPHTETKISASSSQHNSAQYSDRGFAE